MAGLWLADRAWRIVKRTPRFILNSLNGTTDFPVLRPWVTDALKGRIVAWSSLGAVGVGGVAYLMLYPYYTNRVDWWLVGVAFLILGNMSVCFWLRQATGPSSDWMAVHRPHGKRSEPEGTAI